MSKTHYRKFIVTHEVEFEKGKKPTRFSNAFIIPNHYSHTLSSFKELIAEARKDFPKLTDDDVECLTVVESGWCKHCPIIHFQVKPGTTKKDWYACKDHMPDVVWR